MRIGIGFGTTHTPSHHGHKVKAVQPQFSQGAWQEIQAFLKKHPGNKEVALDVIGGLTDAAVAGGTEALENKYPDKDPGKLQVDLSNIVDLTFLNLLVQQQET